MGMVKGITGCSGYACGVLKKISPPSTEFDGTKGTPEEEWAKVLDARQAAADWLQGQAAECRTRGGTEEADILCVHRSMLTDPDFADAIHADVQSGSPATVGVKKAAEQLAEMLRSSGSAYLQERAVDVTDAAAVLSRFLTKNIPELEEDTEDYILFCRELLPSTVLGAGTHTKGFVVAQGSYTAHACILARTRGIPTLVGVGDALETLVEGDVAILDGKNQYLITQPDADMLSKFVELIAKENEKHTQLEQFRGKPTQSADGQSLKLYCNIGSVEEAKLALQADAEGVGLFRSEFLFFDRENLPDEREQASVYSSVLHLMAGKEVIVRTLDIGADKRIHGVALEAEENPALGCRGLRLCFAKPEIFRTQLRALARASIAGNLHIMLPMVCSCEEVQRARTMLEEECNELRNQGVPVADYIPLGVMIETPAAALISAKLAQCSDFFSIGTNDLTQYTMAADRGNPAVVDLYNTAAEPVMTLIKYVVETARVAGIPVGICGESAANPALTQTYLEMGVTELSMAAADILSTRCHIAGLRVVKMTKEGT